MRHAHLAALVAAITLSLGTLPGFALDAGALPHGSAVADSIFTPRDGQVIARTYIRGPRGGCYYINSNGNKTYVDRSKCR